MHRLAHPDGEEGTSWAAAKAGICMGLSAYSTASMEDVIAQGQGNPYAFQMSMYLNHDTMEKMVRRAEGECRPSSRGYLNTAKHYLA